MTSSATDNLIHEDTDIATLNEDFKVIPAPFAHGVVRLLPLLSELKILTKDRSTSRLGGVLNYAQREFIKEVEREINENGEVRIIVLKARQLGISTIIEGIIFIMSMMYDDYQSLIISHESDSAEHILTMTKRYWNTYQFKDYHDEQYNGRKQLAWSDNQSNIVIATAKNTGAGRSKTLHALHASEVAFWDQPDELVTGLRQAIPSQGITMIFYESTANGIGNFFHKTWTQAVTGESEFTPLFYPWHTHPEYDAAYIPRGSKKNFMALTELNKEEKALRVMGIGDSRLLWRRWAIANLCQGDIEKFHQEYPTTPHEAFLSTGRNVFRVDHLLDHYVPMRPDVGNLVKRGNRVEFVKHPDGNLKIYRHPSADKNWGIYQIGADPTHTIAGDQAAAHVLNRRTLEQAAVLALHTDPIQFAVELDKLGRFYNMATIAPEKEGPGYATVGHLLGGGYPMVWESQKIDKTPGKIQSDVHGWGTNKATKPLAIGYLVNALSQPMQKIGATAYGLLLHDEKTFEELKNYVSDERGGFENGDGSPFDDRVMSLGIALATHYIDPPVPPYERDTSNDDLVSEAKAEVEHHMADLAGDEDTAPEAPVWEQWGEETDK
tara:strand:+ start:335 stop:2155 length:1821 start_codon:yes stop_codon:yes gene_type:complete